MEIQDLRLILRPEREPKGSVVRINFDSRILTHLSGNLLKFTIKDSGCGLTSEQQTRLFKPFSQADSSVTRKYGGTGLGLVLARRLAEALGGDVVLSTSKIGEGSTFIVTLDPGTLDGVLCLYSLKSSDLDTRARKDPILEIQEPQKLDGHRVLLAEDSPDTQLLMSRFLGASISRSEYHDHPIVGPILQAFVESLPRRLAALQDAQSRSDHKAIGALSHQLAGSSGSYGYPEMSRIASTIEEYIRNDVYGEPLATSISDFSHLCNAAVRGMETQH